MLKVAPDDRAHPDRLGQPGTPGRSEHIAPDDQVDLRARLRGS